MTILLADLVTRVTTDVPAQSGVPTAAQYEQAVKDAVADLSRRASVTRVLPLAVVAGTAAYTLPADFISLIRLAQIGVPFPQRADVGGYGMGGYGLPGYAGYADPYTLVTPSGLVPMTDAWREQITVAGLTMTIYPTPTISAERNLVYAAGDALVVDSYPTLSDERASVALLLARATCLDRIATSPAGQAVKITAGQDTVDFTGAAGALRTQAQGLREQYGQAVRALNAGSGGLRA